ncbi:MAG: CHASE2 domain-containing protein [Thermodesulfobacteriota bacterium]
MTFKGLKPHAVAGSLLAVLLGLSSPLGLMKSADRVFYDLCHPDQAASRRSDPDVIEDIVIVAIDQPSFDELNMQWPWPRSLHARLIDTLTREEAAVIALDLLFDRPTSAAQDQALAGSIAASGRVVLASAEEPQKGAGFSGTVLVRPMDMLRRHAAVGLATVPLDPDNVVRRYYDLPPEESSFAGATAGRFSGTAIRPAAGAYIPYAGPPYTFQTISYYQALSPEEFLPPDFFKNKIVLVGLSVKTTAGKDRPDTFATPYQRSGAADYMSGVEVQANMIAGLLRRNWITTAGPSAACLLVVLSAVAGSLLQAGWRPVKSAMLAAGAALAYLSAAFICLRWAGLLIPATLPLAAFILPYGLFGGRAYLQGEKRRREIRNAFSKYLSPAILQVVLDNPGALELGGRKRLVTVFFSDLAGFTTISEKLAPEEVAAFLNRYFDVMTEIIFQHKGTVDKFIGDAIMAFWGAPVADPDHSVNACRAALAMQARMESLRRDMQAEGMPALSMRIGLNTGEAIVGNMGSSRLFNYSLLGDTVNLASRLEGANKEFGTAILISRSVVDHAGGKIVVKSLGDIRVKGKAEATAVFELTGMSPEEARE